LGPALILKYSEVFEYLDNCEYSKYLENIEFNEYYENTDTVPG